MFASPLQIHKLKSNHFVAIIGDGAFTWRLVIRALLNKVPALVKDALERSPNPHNYVRHSKKVLFQN